MKTEKRLREVEMKEKGMSCPNGHGKMVMRREKKRMTFRGVNITVPVNQYSESDFRSLS
jgi:ssDNA-binding Zn-finger/Zn-ribbon topoisomerase 1